MIKISTMKICVEVNQLYLKKNLKGKDRKYTNKL